MNERLASIRTPWSEIIRAQHASPEVRAAALEMMAEKYYEPVYEFIRSISGHCQPADAEDRTQQFFQKFLMKNWFDKLDRERGSFRGFLMTAARSFVLDAREHDGRRFKTHEKYRDQVLRDNQAASAISRAEEDYNRAWARGLVADAIEVFHEECLDRGKPHYFSVFEQQLLHPEHYDNPSYEQTAASLGISEKDVANYLHRGKKRINAVLRELVKGSVLSEDEVEKEMMDLRRYFG